MQTTTTLNTQVQSALARLRTDSEAANAQPAADISEARARAGTIYSYWNQGGPDLASIEDREIPSPFGTTRIRIYRPQPRLAESPPPVMTFFHGGGWIVGDLELEDRALRELALAGQFIIVSIDYVLAPEHPFPEPVEDCVNAVRWVHDHATEEGWDADRIVIGGSSAGANLAMAAALSLRDSDEHWLRGVLAFYGVFSTRQDSESHRAFGDGRYTAGALDMAFFLSRYLTDEADMRDPLVDILSADLTGLPPVHLCVAELDTLRDDSVALLARLREARVDITSKTYAGAIHGFTLLVKEVELARQALADAADQVNVWMQQAPGESS